jgi:hypothetical protein
MKQIILITLLLLFSFCSKKEGEEKNLLKKYNTKDLIGTWRIVPSLTDEKILFEPEGKAKILNDSSTEEVFIYQDSLGMRILKDSNQESTLGYFLFSEKTDNLWIGIYNDELVRIERFKEKKKSILQ